MTLIFREAVKHDLPSLVAMLADDELGLTREDNAKPINPLYQLAFKHITADKNNELIVVEWEQQIVGMLQLTYIPYLTYIGSWRCLIEGVRIHKAFRGQGLGTYFFEWAVQRAQEKGCKLVQLTSDKQRPKALKFYESLGFKATHEGFKLRID